jgi:hypothetical protein
VGWVDPLERAAVRALAGLETLVRLESTRVVGGQEKVDNRFDMSSRVLSASEALDASRADDYRQQENHNAERRVLGELRSIAGDAKLSAQEKRMAVFAAWEMCDGDGDAQWQRVVEAFIQDRMPRDSELGYSSELLARLNRKRASVRSFAP